MRSSGVEVKLHIFLTSALDVSEWLASRLGHTNPKEWSPVGKPVSTTTEWVTLKWLLKKISKSDLEWFQIAITAEI